jgi:hypothetical protein
MLPMTRDGSPSFLRSSSRRSTSMYTSSGSRHFFSNARRCFQKCPSSKLRRYQSSERTASCQGLEQPSMGQDWYPSFRVGSECGTR